MKEHRLTSQEREEFRTNGYLVIADALSASHVDRLRAAIDKHAEGRRDPDRPNVNVADCLGLDDAFLDLVDCPTVFPKIWGILGWNIWVHHSHFNLNMPNAGKKWPGENFGYGWHRDGGATHRDLHGRAMPLLLTKVGFYLTDVERKHGPTLVLPGSLDGELPPTSALPSHARALELKTGTAVIYDNRLVHSLQSPNESDVARKAVFIQYGYRWMQPMDRQSVAHLAHRLDEVRKQLLGLTHTWTLGSAKGRSGRYYPKEEDVPLRRYIKELLGDEASGCVARSVDDSEVLPDYA